ERAALAAEGIELRTETVISALFGTGERLTGVRLETAAVDGGDPAIEMRDADTVILAMGRVPELVFCPVVTAERAVKMEAEGQEQVEPETYPELAVAPTWKTAEVHRTLSALNVAGIFSSPESGRTSDASAVVRAILSGRRMVRGVHHALMGRRIEPLPDLAVESDEILDVRQIFGVTVTPRHESADFQPEPSTMADWTAAAERSGLSDEDARAEAQRCLQCGLICYKKTI
ncbi:MAG: hypothetical protein V1774_00690, partial [Candidatus Eisenbacteria bacterium]